MTQTFQPVTSAGDGPGDLLLVQSALGGDRAAIDRLVARLGCVPRFVWRLNRSLRYGLPAEALEDVVQQVYAVLWPKLAEFHGRNALETWVYAFCRNCLRSAWRRRSGHGQAYLSDEMLAALSVDESGPALQADRREILGALREELDRLPEAEREVVEARHLDGRSFEELARASGVAVSTVKDRCYRAMQRLQERLGRRVLGG